MRTEAGVTRFPLPNFRGLRAFYETELWVQLHEGLALISSIMVQAVLLIFVRILAPGLWSVAILGALVFSFFTLGQRVLNEAAYIRVDHKLNELYLASPLTPESYFLGMSLGVLVAYLPPIMVLAVLAVLTVPLPVLTWFLLPAVLIAVWLFSSSLGYILSTQFKDMRAIWSYASLLYNFFGVLPPVFYPIGLVPSGGRFWVLLLPPSAASSLVQWSLDHSVLSSTELAVAVVALVTESLGIFLFAIYWARRSVREA